MKYFSLLLATAFINCRSNEVAKQNKAATATTTHSEIVCDYEQRKSRCKNLFTRYNQSKNGKQLQELQLYFADSLLPCWYGTAWDYNGTATVPSNGKIACGYFITTTLQHAGLSINRIEMAQCPSSKLIRSVCTGIKIYSNKPVEELIGQVIQSGAGLYIAGLDYHTGFIWYDGKEVYFIHAGFYGRKCVIKEKAIDCTVLKNSKLKMTGKVNFEQ